MSAIITIRNLSKFYRVGHEKVRALSNINLEINKGEICCILGTSGSGKSTLLNQLAGLEKPTAGSVHIGKTNISKLSENQLAGFRQKNIGFVFQSYNLLPSMTAAENVAMPLLFRGVDRSTREREASVMLKKVGLGNRMRHKPSEMSGGQQQRVGIARAFVARPKIVFADEPTGNLDSRTTLEVMRLLIEMSHQNGITFVLVTHDNELANYADRVVTIKDGEIQSDRKNEHPAYLDTPQEHADRLSRLTRDDNGFPRGADPPPPDPVLPPDTQPSPVPDETPPDTDIPSDRVAEAMCAAVPCDAPPDTDIPSAIDRVAEAMCAAVPCDAPPVPDETPPPDETAAPALAPEALPTEEEPPGSSPPKLPDESARHRRHGKIRRDRA